MKDHTCRPTAAPQALIDSINLAVKYEEARLVGGMSDQTRRALGNMKDFLNQPSEAYCSCHFVAKDLMRDAGRNDEALSVDERIRRRKEQNAKSYPGCGLSCYPCECEVDEVYERIRYKRRPIS